MNVEYFTEKERQHQICVSIILDVSVVIYDSFAEDNS